MRATAQQQNYSQKGYANQQPQQPQNETGPEIPVFVPNLAQPVKRYRPISELTERAGQFVFNEAFMRSSEKGSWIELNAIFRSPRGELFAIRVSPKTLGYLKARVLENNPLFNIAITSDGYPQFS